MFDIRLFKQLEMIVPSMCFPFCQSNGHLEIKFSVKQFEYCTTHSTALNGKNFCISVAFVVWPIHFRAQLFDIRVALARISSANLFVSAHNRYALSIL